MNKSLSQKAAIMPVIQRILAAVDFSPHSQAIIDHACEIAKRADAELHIVHVESRANPATNPDGSPSGEATRLGLERLDSLVRPADELELATKKKILNGIPHRAIVDYAAANGITQIVMGTHGRKGLSYLALGSVAQHVLRDAPCPVQILKTPKRVERPQENAIEEMPLTFGRELADSSAATQLISRALTLRATDIHVDPIDETQTRVRFRIDGKLSEYCRLDREVADPLINQWKMLADIDISDPFTPKEGRFSFPRSLAEFHNTEARITTAPVVDGESVAIRLLSHEDVFIPINELGLGENSQRSVDEMLGRNEGIILVTGPTGSGKTTTVYTMLETISTSGLNIVSIEDPVEYSLPFVRQMAVDERRGINMTTGMRTMLRMDPDVMFLGEIRDAEAAAIAMRAASSGQFVFSTLHTRDVASVFTALRDLGLPNRTLTANFAGIVNQRLIRRLCSDCRQAVDVTTEARALFDRHSLIAPDQLYEASGCVNCRDSGYRGRIGVFEAIAFDDNIRAAIADTANEAELRQKLLHNGMTSLDDDALEKVIKGVTDLDEAIRVRWLA